MDKMEADPSLMSYADLHGEWENREISIFGVVKSFISQLSIGQELTKVSMPSIFLMPYSILELAASRYLKYIHLLISAQHESDPVRRMSIIIQYFFSCVRDGNFTKKPYNALLGEVHKCFVNYPSIDGNSTSQARFIGQQVTHHPPLTAFNITTDEGISLDCNVQFSAKFHMNSVSVVTSGAITIKIPVVDANGQTNVESYIIDKGLPDALVKNVIFGTRSIYWTDAVDIMCKDTNTSATLHFDKNEYVKGEIYTYNDDDVPQHQASLKGYISDVVNIDYLEAKSSEASSATKSSSKKSKKKKHHHKHHTSSPTDTVLIDTKTLNPNQTLYPRQTDSIASLVVWKDVTKNIIAGDMASSDVVKKEIEDEQRKRLQKSKEDEKKERTYFKFNDESEIWEFKGPNPPTNN